MDFAGQLEKDFCSLFQNNTVEKDLLNAFVADAMRQITPFLSKNAPVQFEIPIRIVALKDGEIAASPVGDTGAGTIKFTVLSGANEQTPGS